MKRSFFALGTVLGLSVTLTFSLLTAVSHAQSLDESSTLVCTIPVGGARGVHYEGVNTDEMIPWGPAAFTVGEDGSFIVLDTAANRLLQYSSSCEFVRKIPLGKEVVGATDVEAKDGYWVLDSSAPAPAVLHLARNGRTLGRYPVPERLQTGLSGLAKGTDGQILLEREGGARVIPVTQMARSTGSEREAPMGYPVAGTRYSAHPAAWDTGEENAMRGFILAGDKQIEVKASRRLAGLRFLKIGRDGSFSVIAEDLGLRAGAIAVDQTVRRYNSKGNLLGMARAPLDQQFVFVGHALSADSRNRHVYTLVTFPDRVEIRRLVFSTALEAYSHDPPREGIPAVQAGTGCSITKEQIIANAKVYTGNIKYLSEENINGECATRRKPRYLQGAKNYRSVPYDFNGGDTVEAFNDLMDRGKLAGDINRVPLDGEDCSRGVDCSGFVSRVWNMGKRGTCTIDEKHTWALGGVEELRAGDILIRPGTHVILFFKRGDGGLWVYEATKTNRYDRVVQRWVAWSEFTGYRPKRFNQVCDKVKGRIGYLDKDAHLYFWGMLINFHGGSFYGRGWGEDYGGSAVYYKLNGSYNTSENSMVVRVRMYSDTAYTHLLRNDVCQGEWTEGNPDYNFYDQECQPENDPGPGYQRIWLILSRE